MLIRTLGSMPEGVTYAILLMNAATPLINRWTSADSWTGGAEKLNESVRMIVVLAVIAMLSGGLLAGVYEWTSGIIAENELREMQSSVFQVLPGTVRIELLDTAPSTLVEDDPTTMREVEQTTTQIFVGYDDRDDVTGFAFVGEGAGYGGAIRILVGVDDNSGAILGLAVLSHSETSRSRFQD